LTPLLGRAVGFLTKAPDCRYTVASFEVKSSQESFAAEISVDPVSTLEDA